MLNHYNTDLRLNSSTSINTSQLQQTRRKENQYFFGPPDLILCPPRWTLGINFAGHHGVHDDVISIFSEFVHNRGHIITKSVILWVVAAVVKF